MSYNIKKSCAGCKALQDSGIYQFNPSCELKYKIVVGKLDHKWMIYEYIKPITPCPKPRTYKALVKLLLEK